MGEEMPSSSLADTADTQKADELLSLSMQELKVSQETPAKVWARLYPENQEISQYYGKYYSLHVIIILYIQVVDSILTLQV